MNLPEQEIHVWLAPLSVSPATREHLYQTLSSDERERAARFHFDVHSHVYVVGRGVLRSILSQYLGAPPGSLEFLYATNGRPAVGGSEVHFNVSHSKDLALYALARQPLVGVDIEWIHPVSDAINIAKRFFSPAECADLLALDKNQRLQGFYNCWTRKEAYLKAIGHGLHASLNSFQVTLTPEQPAAMVSIKGDRHRASQWTIIDVRPAQGYVGAAAVYGRGWKLVRKHWRGNVMASG